MRIAIASLAILAGCAATLAGPSSRLGKLADPEYPEHYEGCACGLYRGGDTTDHVYLSSVDGKEAWFNIDGTTRRLQLVGPDEREPRGVLNRTYIHGKDTVVVRGTFTDDCKPGGEACDGRGLVGTITLSSGASVERVPVKGGCGC